MNLRFPFCTASGPSFPSKLIKGVLSLFSGAHLQITVRFNWIYLHRYQFLRCYYFIIIGLNFSANDFVKKKFIFIPTYFNNGSKIYMAIIPFSEIFLLQRVKLWKLLFWALEVIKWICFLWRFEEGKIIFLNSFFWGRTSNVNINFSFFQDFCD